MPTDLPALFAEAVAAERGELRRLTERARLLAKERDQAALRILADEVRRRIEAGAAPTGGHLSSHVGDIIAALGDVYDEVFPVHDPGDPADVLDAPWPTGRRMALLGAIVGHPGRSIGYLPPKEPLVEPAIAAGDVRLLRLLVRSPVGHLWRESVVRVLDALFALDALDVEVVEHALLTDLALGFGLLGRSPVNNEVVAPPAACAVAVQAVFDELLWRLTAPDGPAAWTRLPRVLVPRGLRFVRRSMGWPDDHPVAARLGAATLTVSERAVLVDELRGRPMAERLRAFHLRLPAGDAWALLPLLGLAGGESLLTLIQSLSAAQDVVRQDRAAILAVAGQFGTDGTRRVLELCPSELVSAALGWNRAAVLKRVKHNALWGIAAYGLLPLQDGETVQERYRELREVAKRGAKLGANRRHSHAAAIEVALDHLAQVAGFPDASSLEWECAARIAGASPPEARIGDYSIGLHMQGAEPVIAVSKAGKPLKSVPAAVRSHPSYAELREHQERLRDQARRLRTGLVERLVATSGVLQPDELTGLRGLPSGAALLSALVWQDRAGEIGLLDRLDLAGPVTAVHPFLLYERQVLAHWQAEIVRQRIRQPVKQVFRELYLVTPAEREAVDVSRRFAGHVVNGKVAGQLLSGRGWSTHGEYDKHQATRPAAPGLTAALRCDLHGYFGIGDVLTGEVQFLAGNGPVPLANVPPVAFSEVMRDLDLVVGVAGTEPAGYASPFRADSRAQLLAALIEDMGLGRVTVEGTSALVRGSRATYRVHLTSGSIHLEPGGYLCVVPKSFGGAAHRELFLPFADEDRMTSVILSKVLLLNDDEHITDPAILAQLPPGGR